MSAVSVVKHAIVYSVAWWNAMYGPWDRIEVLAFGSFSETAAKVSLDIMLVCLKVRIRLL